MRKCILFYLFLISFILDLCGDLLNFITLHFAAILGSTFVD